MINGKILSELSLAKLLSVRDPKTVYVVMVSPDFQQVETVWDSETVSTMRESGCTVYAHYRNGERF